jgi:glucose-1-phosphate adenylyltransferase
MDYRKMFAHHEAHDADITIATIPVVAQDAPGFGILKTGPDHDITEFHEKPPLDQLDGKESPVEDELRAQGRIYLASMGIYIFNKDLLRDMLADNPSMHDFGRELIPASIKTNRVISYPFSGYWSDIGTIRSFFEANIMLTQPHPPFTVYDPKSPLYTSIRTLPHAKINNAKVQNSIIAEASVLVDCEVEDSVIGIRSYIGRGAQIKRTVMMGADYFHWHDSSLREPSEGPDKPGIDEGTYIEGAIIDRNVSIGQDCRIVNKDQVQEGGDNERFYIREGIVIIGKNARIEDGTVI